MEKKEIILVVLEGEGELKKENMQISTPTFFIGAKCVEMHITKRYLNIIKTSGSLCSVNLSRDNIRASAAQHHCIVLNCMGAK